MGLFSWLRRNQKSEGGKTLGKASVGATLTLDDIARMSSSGLASKTEAVYAC